MENIEQIRFTSKLIDGIKKELITTIANDKSLESFDEMELKIYIALKFEQLIMQKPTNKIIEKSQYKTNCPASCPKCHSENIEYGMFQPDNDDCYWEIICQECGLHSKEYYSISFIECIGEE